eukprot:7907724-Pyramimonas_sp.AAC.1
MRMIPSLERSLSSLRRRGSTTVLGLWPTPLPFGHLRVGPGRKGEMQRRLGKPSISRLGNTVERQRSSNLRNSSCVGWVVTGRQE